MKRFALSFLSLGCALAHAEPMYISDKLVVNVYVEADAESNKLTTLDSGDAVEAIEKVDSYTRVRLPDSREGWIKSSYLSSQVPALVRLKELEKERGTDAGAPSAQLTDELAKIKAQNAALQLELTAAKQAATPTTPTPATDSVSANVPALVQPERPAEVPARSDVSLASLPLSWGAGLALLGAAMGFLLGYQTLARRIRRKYGSMRIY